MAWIDVSQLSPDWLRMRCGIPTASGLEIIMSPPLKSGPNKGERRAEYANYLFEKSAEWIRGRMEENYVTPAMDYGNANEALGREDYAVNNECEVLPGGFYVSDELKRFGASPDGRVGDVGLLEIKCLQPLAHGRILVSEQVPIEYQWQQIGQLICAPEREWNDFYAFDPYGLRPFQKRMYREQEKERIKQAEDGINEFLEAMVPLIRQLKGEPLMAIQT